MREGEAGLGGGLSDGKICRKGQRRRWKDVGLGEGGGDGELLFRDLDSNMIIVMNKIEGFFYYFIIEFTLNSFFICAFFFAKLSKNL